MIRKLRKRFIFSAMLAFSMVMIVIITGINVVNYVQTAARLDQMTEILMITADAPPKGVMDKGFPPINARREFGREAEFTTRFFTVQYDTNGNVERIFREFISEIDEQTAEEYGKTVLKSGVERGYFQHFRYRVSRTDDKATVVFLNSEMDLLSIYRLRMLSIGMGIISFVAVTVLVILFSKKAIRPFERNIERQKQFITDAGHELKTPITSIATSADIAAMEHEGDEWIINIQNQTARLTKLVANLVALSRLDEEEPFLEKGLFSLSEAAWEIAEPFSALAKANGKKYHQAIDDDINYFGNKEGIQQIISILLDNAIKYSAGEGNIELKVYGKGKKTFIEVINFCSFEKNVDPNRLFDRFYRVEDSHATSTGGTGIGLSMALAIAEAHGGDIRATLMEDNKISFKVSL